MKPKYNNPYLAILRHRSSLAGLGAVLLTGNALGGTLYWDNNGTTAGASTANANWLGGSTWTTNSAGTIANVAWTNGESAVFAAGTTWAAATSTTITISGSVTTPSINFEDKPTTGTRTRTITGGTINIGGGSITSSSWNAGDNGNNAHDVVITSVLAGSGGLTIAAHGNATDDGGGGGGSEFRLGGNNTFTGGLTITSGVVSWRDNTHLGNAANVITLNGGGLLYNDQASFATPRNIQIGASGGTIRLYGGKTLACYGTLSNASGVASTTFRRTDGGALHLIGSVNDFAGTFINGNSDTFFWQPDLDLSDVTLRVNNGNVQIMRGGALTLASLESSNGELNLNNGTALTLTNGNVLHNGGNIRSNSGAPGSITSSSGTLTFTGGAATGDLTGSSAQVQVTITDSGATPVAVVKNNNADEVFTRANAYSGGTTINGGRIQAKTGAFGSGPVTVNAGGQAWLQGAGPYANGFTLNGNGPGEGGNNYGALRFTAPSTITGPVNVASASRLTAYDPEDVGILSGALTGSAPLEKTGNGVVSLSGNNAGYTGAVTGAQGILHIGSSLPGSSVTINDNAVLAGEGGIGGGLTLGSSSGAGLYVDGSTPAALTTTNLTVNGVAVVRALSLPAIQGTPIPVINYTGSLSLPGSANDSFVLVDAASYRNLPSFTDTGSAITLTIPAGTNLAWQGNDLTNPGYWDVAVTSNWLNGPTPDGFYTGDNVLFDDTGITKTIELRGMLSPATVTFNNSAGNDYTFTGAGGVGFSGPTSIVKNGAGRVTIQGYGHNYTGSVVVNAGYLQPQGNWEMLGNSSGLYVNNGGQFNINGANLGDFQRHYRFTLAGSGPDGSGALNNTSGDSPYESAGILELVLTADASVGSSGGRYDIGRSGDSFGSIKGNGFTFTKVGSGTVGVRAAASNITYVVAEGVLKVEDAPSALGTNPVTVLGGATLQSYGYLVMPSQVNLAEAATIENDGGGRQIWTGQIHLTGDPGTAAYLKASNDELHFSGVISGDGGIMTTGGNNVYLTGGSSNTYAGMTNLNSTGQLIMAKGGGAVAVPGDVTISNGGDRAILSATKDNQFGPNSVLHFTGTAESRFELKGTTQTLAGLDYPVATNGFKAVQHSEYGAPVAVDAVSDLILNVTGSNSYTYTGDLRDQGGTVNVVKNGSGTQILAGNGIDYRGTTTVNAGLLVGTGDDFWTSVLTIAPGATYEARITTTPDVEGYEMKFPGSVITGGGTYLKTGTGKMSPTWDGGGSVSMLSGSLIDIQGGEMRLEWGGGTWTSNKSDLNLAAGASFNMWDNGNAGVFVDALTGSGSIIRTNYNSTSNLTVGVDGGGGSFAGSISNSIGKINLVKEGSGTQTLSGVHTYTGNTTVNGGTLALSATSSLKFAVTDGGANQVSGAGTVTFDGAFDIDTSAVTVTTGTWTLVNAATLNETFGATFTLSGGWTEVSNVWTKTVGSRLYTFKESDGALTVGPSASYASWIDSYFPGQTNPAIIGKDADPDGDGIANAVEMVLGGDPKNAMDAALLPTLELVTNPAGVPAGNYLLVTYRRSDLSVTASVASTLEYDLDLLGVWTTAQDNVGGVKILVDDNYGSFVPPAANTDRIRVYVPRGNSATLFGRVRAVAP